ncbi:hypothetical protein KST10_07425 [Fusobacterium animalis]|uniref:Uncharacterized protein n=1 Tax=Fusobacterium nucleatum TaxID=851 RepID=A0A133P169_FUSNU|nr:hypothetical protein [Fusobacterium nucleatum]KXA22290.1 hypothetical protein HMPREF3221_00947 [Fusobacterium nucleatum]MCL4582985.1 hypothetical protein [Fusobacterium nucleatum YWH7054]
MKEIINYQKIKEDLEKNQKGYIVKKHCLFYLSNQIKIHSLGNISQIEFINLYSIENIYQIDDLEVPTKLTFTLKKQYGKDVDNLLLVFSDGKWHELWIEKIF